MKTIVTFELSDVAYRCGIATSDIVEFINDEWILPHDRERLLFDEEDIARIILISDLKVQFGVNDEAVPIILHLLDQLKSLSHLVKNNS